MFAGGQLDWSESHPLCLLGASWVAPICFEEELVLFVGEQVAVAGAASLGTCSNESPVLLPTQLPSPVRACYFVLSGCPHPRM